MSEAIQTVIDEFKTLSPEISKIAVFRFSGEVLAASKDTTPEQIQALIACLNGVKHVGCIGGLKDYVIQDGNSQLLITQVDDAYFVALHSRSGDQKRINSLLKVIAPSVIRLALGTTVARLADNELESSAVVEERKVDVERLVVEKPTCQDVVASRLMLESKPNVPSSQFMVERIGGFLVAPDVVRIDGDVVVGWQVYFEGKPISKVVVETLEGKSVICKFRVQNGAKGVLGVPDKILKALGCSKGALVMVKPVIK